MLMIKKATGDGSLDEQADQVASIVTTYGRRFYPSEAAFPVGAMNDDVVSFPTILLFS